MRNLPLTIFLVNNSWDDNFNLYLTRLRDKVFWFSFHSPDHCFWFAFFIFGENLNRCTNALLAKNPSRANVVNYALELDHKVFKTYGQFQDCNSSIISRIQIKRNYQIWLNCKNSNSGLVGYLINKPGIEMISNPMINNGSEEFSLSLEIEKLH